MKKVALFFLILLSSRVNSQNTLTENIEYNPKMSTVSVIFANIKFLPDSILSLYFETLRIEKCHNLNFNLLFNQLSRKIELHTLYLRDCDVFYLPKEIAKIPNLKVLILDNNNLKTISSGITKMELNELDITMNNIGRLSYRNQTKFFASIRNLASSSGMHLNLRSNGLDSLPDSFKNINLTGIDISDNYFDQFPGVLSLMTNDENLRNITIDNMKTLLHIPNPLSKILNKFNRSFVNISINCFVDDSCCSEKDLDYLNNTYPAIHFSTRWAGAKRTNPR